MNNTESDCGDNGCYFAKTKGGMRTNGGCRCFDAAGFTKSLASAAREMLPELLKLRAEVERLKARCARDDAGVTIHACPAKGGGMMPCCNRPPFEVTADRMTTNPALVNCDRVRLQTERTALAQENARLTEHLRMMQHGESEALKMMTAEKQRADVLAEGVRVLMAKHDGTAPSMQAARAWESEHGHLVGDGK